ncbi:hypothetical protein A3K72_03355 [Candidatus Woesearchaeota archaeon RBG_13_36_6]|nr:MAG: hypothetical protein A3K72_03355 [Candidatus Woesearchaeota archaeon RBG_13_36_6]
MIKDFEPRLYQQTILATTVEKNSLVVLPTGMGKTNIFLMLAAQRLRQYPQSKIMLLGPTRPLIDQYYNVFKQHFEIKEDQMAIFTGHVNPEKRAELWKTAKIIFSTPQGLENDIISNKISLKEVSLLGFDEAHKAVGNYAYVWIAEQYQKSSEFPRIIGMTASPGSKLEQIQDVCKNLYIEAIEVRTEFDPDVRPYIQEIKIRWIHVDLPPSFIQIRNFLDDFMKAKLKEIHKMGFLGAAQIKAMSKKDLLLLQGGLQGRLAQGEKDYWVMKGISLTAEAIKVHHALELIETQGIEALYKYLKQLQSQARTTKVKAVKNLVQDLNFRSALVKTERLYEAKLEHPKMAMLREVVKELIQKNPNQKTIVFTQYRDSALRIIEELNKVVNVEPRIFVGQMKKGETGLSQKEQKKVLDEFREGKFNTLVATSIAEEGLDIPKVDTVIFYEPIPSAIRHIQRKGRTGRLEKGEVIVLVTRKTRDEAYKWSALQKEQRMYRILKDLKNKVALQEKKQPTLKSYIPEEQVTIFADYREKGSGTIKELIELGAKLKLEKLETADYLASEDVGVELKTVPDFVNSLIDGRLLSQLKELKKNFEKPVVIVEGTQDIYSIRNVHPNAIRGLLTTIVVDYNIPILFSRNPKETASFLNIIAKHEQLEERKDVFLHGDKKPLTLKELQEYIISALPGVGATLAKPLLRKFKTVKDVINASEEELKDVELIGDKKAKRIKELTDSKYG